MFIIIAPEWKFSYYFCMRAKATSVSNPRTDGQVNQRTKFALVLAILKPITGFLRVGYKKYAIKQTAFNAAMSYILNNAVTGSSSADYSVDLAKVLVSRGNLTGAANAKVTSAGGVVTLTC